MPKSSEIFLPNKLNSVWPIVVTGYLSEVDKWMNERGRN